MFCHSMQCPLYFQIFQNYSLVILDVYVYCTQTSPRYSSLYFYLPWPNDRKRSYLKLCLHWQRLCDNAGDSDSYYLLALATLGDATQIGFFLFLAASPKVAKASTVSCRCC
jgi:hypothetical protein